MDPQIHGALVGGVLGGATAAFAVGLERWTQGRHDRRAQTVAAIDRLNRRIRDAVDADQDHSQDPAWDVLGDLWVEIDTIERCSGAFGWRRKARVLAALEDLAVIWIATDERHRKLDSVATDERHLNGLERRSFLSGVARLRKAVERRPTATTVGHLSRIPYAQMEEWRRSGANADDLLPLPLTRYAAARYRIQLWWKHQLDRLAEADRKRDAAKVRPDSGATAATHPEP